MKYLLAFLLIGLSACTTSPKQSSTEPIDVRTPASSDVVKIIAADSTEGVRILRSGDRQSATFEYCTNLAFGGGDCEMLGTVDQTSLPIFNKRVGDRIQSLAEGNIGRSGLCGITLGLSLVFTRNPFSEDSNEKNYKDIQSCSVDALTKNSNGDLVTKLSGKALRKFFYGVFKG